MISRRQGIAGIAALGIGIPARARSSAADRFLGLPSAFARIEALHGGRLGVAVFDTGHGWQAGHREQDRFPMGSTYKMLATAAVLARVDAGKESLDRRVVFTRQDLVTYSPATEKLAGGDGMTLAALCDAAVTVSDNTAGNLLLRVIGGPEGLTAYLRGIGDDITRLDRTEPTLNEARPGDPRDTTSPAAMLGDLRFLTMGNGLSASSRQHLQKWLRASRTGDARLRARLPAGWQAGEKTGTAANGTSNDVGLLWPPGGGPVLVAAFLTHGSPDGATRDAALAEVGAVIAAALEFRS